MEHKRIWDKTLNPNEEVKYEFSVSQRYRMIMLVGWCAIGGMFLLSSFAAGLGFFMVAFSAFYFGFYMKAANAYAFTDRRVLVHRGWLSTKLISIDYSKITDITVHEPLISRLVFGTGAIKIDAAGTNRENVIIGQVESPYEIKKRLDSLRSGTQL